MSDLTIIEGGQLKKGRVRPKGESSGLNKSQKKIMKLHDVGDLVAAKGLGVSLSSVDDGTGVRKLIEINDKKEVR